jgi:hypothetical protein
MIDFAELGSWVLALVLTLGIVAVVFGMIWLCFTYPVGMLWVVGFAFIFIFVHKGQ